MDIITPEVLVQTGAVSAPLLVVLAALLAPSRRLSYTGARPLSPCTALLFRTAPAQEKDEPSAPQAPVAQKKPVFVHRADTGDNSGLIAALVAAAGAIVAALAPKWWDKRHRPKGESAESEAVLNGLAGISDIIARLADMEEYGAERIVLFRGHNGGGYPTPGMPFYVSASQWHTAKGHDGDPISNYRNIMVDSEYIKMLLSAWTGELRYVYLVTASMPSCQLKRWYEAEGVTSSAVFVMGIQDKSLFYLSAAKYGGEFTEGQLTSIQLATNGIWQDMIQVKDTKR